MPPSAEFDKRTALGVSGRFPEAVGPVDFLSRSVAKDLCAQLSTELLSIVPRLDDYLCPVCMSIAYWPVRLGCGHLFCLRCIVKLQRTRIRCPMCRSTSLGEADAGEFIHQTSAKLPAFLPVVSGWMDSWADSEILANLDDELKRFMRRHFPKEVGEKSWSNERERGKEMYGEDYEPEKCTVM